MVERLPNWHEQGPSQREIVRRATLLRAEFGVLRLSWPCLVLDISPHGAGVRFDRAHEVEVGMASNLRLAEYGIIRSEIRHAEPTAAGVWFLHAGARDVEMIRWLASLHIY